MTKWMSTDSVIFPDYSAQNMVKTMELAGKHVHCPPRSRISRAERKPLIEADYYSELRTWLQHCIIEAEEKEDFSKKGRLLSLLKEL